MDLHDLPPELFRTIGEVATSQRETARAVMSFMLITVVGVALVALLLSNSGDAGDLRKTVIASILTLLGTIVGFYFGTRAAETGGDSTAQPRAPAAFGEAPPVLAGSAEALAPASEPFPPGPEAAAPARDTEGEAPPPVAKETPPVAGKETPPEVE
jgi:hypothetical protein